MATPTLERDLALVFPLDSGAVAYSKPVSTKTFESNYMALAKVYSTILDQGLLPTGHSVAARMLYELQAAGHADADLFLADIRQRTTIGIHVPDPTEEGPGTYETHQMQNAITKNLIDEDDVKRIENLMVFIIAASRLSGSKVRAAHVERVVCALTSAQRTSLTPTAFLNSLLTSMQDVASGANAPVQTEEPEA